MNRQLTYDVHDGRQPQEPARLWGHVRGRDVRLEMEALLDKLRSGGTLLVNLANVEVMDVSFSTEAFARLLSSIGSMYPGVAMAFSKPNDYVQENLDAALKNKGLMALIIHGPRKWDLIGKVSETDKPTLEVLRKRKQATAPDVAKDLDLNLTTANQRLRKLSEGGLIIRTKVAASTGGDQYMYEWPAQ